MHECHTVMNILTLLLAATHTSICFCIVLYDPLYSNVLILQTAVFAIYWDISQRFADLTSRVSAYVAELIGIVAPFV